MNNKFRNLICGIIAALIACFFSETATAQITDSGYVLFLKTPRLQSYPPLNTGMPLDVLIGYIYLDSLRKQNPNKIDSFFERLTDSDTLRYALKYLYKIDDDDPIRFMNYRRTSPAPRSRPRYYPTSGELIRADLLQQAGRVFHDSERTEMMCEANVIAHIRVTGLEYDTITGKWGREFGRQIIVNSEIIDTIKGRVLPTCTDIYSAKEKGNHTLTAQNCLPFCYSPQEHLSGLTGDVDYGFRHTMTDSLGNPWVKLGGEYIAFLNFDLVGGDSLSIYYTTYLSKCHTTQGSLYQVIDGLVNDPNNDMGFGINPSVSVFIAGLRSKIYSITHP